MKKILSFLLQGTALLAGLLLIVSAVFLAMLFLTGTQGVILWGVTSVIMVIIGGYAISGFFKLKGTLHRKSINITLLMFSFLAIPLTLAPAVLNLTLQVADRYTSVSSAPIDSDRKLQHYKYMLESYSGENQNLENYIQVKEGSVTFYFKEEINKELIQKVLDEISDNRDQYAIVFSKLPERKLSIFFYDHEIEVPRIDNVSTDTTMLGAYHEATASIHLLTPDSLGGEEEFKRTFRHEYAHFLFHSLMNEKDVSLLKVPVWLNEGTAVYFEGNSLEGSETAYQPFHSLTTPGEWEKSISFDYSPYFQSGLFVTYFLEQEGTDILQRLLTEMNKSTFDEAFEKVTTKPFTEYEANFLEQMKKDGRIQ
ncbi:hypothetical protein GJU40_06935 [Bacillus lacus]|uniref:Peptidase MA-like domain-containing protein n=1 Tax=Metabacillus lacus TaxID=1983721 RepID=A0A7X2IYN3_9BACI|nr:hypothetical protein [Metabacillus lacus]MRX71907.1 hypothetical protein [Metabacillus lacus]